MNLFRLFFELFLLYVLYKFIFEFVIPIYQTTKHIKRKMNDMNQKMNENSSNHSFTEKNQHTTVSKPKEEDYIDYEEIK